MQNQNIEGLENCASEVDNAKIDVLPMKLTWITSGAILPHRSEKVCAK